jgi:hypothetical protein
MGGPRTPTPLPNLSRPYGFDATLHPITRGDALCCCVALVPLLGCIVPNTMGDASVPSPLPNLSRPYFDPSPSLVSTLCTALFLYTLGKYIYTPSTSTGNCGSTR